MIRPEVAYQTGWEGAAQPGADMPKAEAAFLAEHGDGWFSWWLDGWMDRVRGKEYMHRMDCFEPYEHCDTCRADRYSGEEWY